MADPNKTTTAIDKPMTGEEILAKALRGKIRMHEFLMSGGVQMGYDADGKMQYSGPISVEGFPECPWHGPDCVAWGEIQAGRGEWTRMEAQLAGMIKMRDLGLDSPQVHAEIAALTLKLEERPRDAKKLRDRTDEEYKAELAQQKPRVYAAAPNQGKPGNPWDKGRTGGTGSGRTSHKSDTNPSRYSSVSREPYKPTPKPKASETIKLTGLVQSADVIEIDGDEEDE